MMTAQSVRQGPSPVLEPLFNKFGATSINLRNRFVMAPMTRDQSPGGIPNAENIEYYRQRAAGGVGMIITEGTFPRAYAAGISPNAPHMYGQESAEGWRRVVEAVHAEGTAIFSQVMHMGVMRGTEVEFEPEQPTISPSGIGINGEKVGRSINADDMETLLESYVESASLAQAIGFDGIEIHGAHGLVLDNFLWSSTNQRTDGYGGDLERRVRFPSEVVAAVRAAVGPKFPISYRFSQWKVGQYDASVATTPLELERVLAPLAEAGVDIFHPSTRRHWLPAFPDEQSPDSRLSLAGWTKKITGKPTIMVGSVAIDHAFVGDEAAVKGYKQDERLKYLIEQFEREEFDLIAVGRALLADPAWVNKMGSNDLANITPFKGQF